MNGIFKLVVALGAGVILSACGGDDDEGDGGGSPKLYCQVEDSSGAVTGCNEHEIPASALDASRDACTSGGGTVVDECPSENRVGRCKLADAGIVFGYYAPDDPADAEEMCSALGGDWSSG